MAPQLGHTWLEVLGVPPIPTDSTDTAPGWGELCLELAGNI